MQIQLNENEMRYIDTSVFGWKIKDNCPKQIKKKIQDKIKLLSDYQEKILNNDLFKNRR